MYMKYTLGHHLLVFPELQSINLYPILSGILIQNTVNFKTRKPISLPEVLMILKFYSAASRGNSLGKLTA